MTQEQAQELAITTWGATAIAEIHTFADGIPHCFVSRTKYGLSAPYGHGDTWEQAFYNSQFGYSTRAVHEEGNQLCHFDGFTGNRSQWPNDWAVAASAVAA